MIKNLFAWIKGKVYNKNRTDVEDSYLRKYIRKTCISNLEKCESILGSDESLKRFAELWDKDKEGIMMMVTSMEYEFFSGREFTHDELAAVRHVVGNVAMFFKSASEEFYLKELLREKMENR